MPSWCALAPLVQEPIVEISFRLVPFVRLGADVSGTADTSTAVEPLRWPACVAPGEPAMTIVQAEAHLPELIAYYEDVIRAARRHGQRVDALRHCFWMRLRIVGEADGRHIDFGFPWLDSLQELAVVLEALADPPASGEVFADRDQGWEIEIHADAHRCFLRETDPDAGELRAEAQMPRARLSHDAADALHRARRVVALLVEALKDDAWTDPRAPLSFDRLTLRP